MKTQFFTLVMLTFVAILSQNCKPDQSTKSAPVIQKESKQKRVALTNEHFFNATKDPALGYPPIERLIPIKKKMAKLKSSQKNISNLAAIGPINVGGRSRAFIFDPNDNTNKKAWSGGVSGGLWYNNDVTDENSSWTLVDNFWSSICVTAIIADPQNSQVFYVGTGEGYGVGSLPGDGIFKTTDGGNTWIHLSNSSFFTNINDLIIRVENGVSALYVAAQNDETDKIPNANTDGLYKSTNGGSTFTQVLPQINGAYYAVSDLELGTDNRLYVGTINNTNDEGGGNLWYTDNGTNWNIVNLFPDGDRVELAPAPTNANIIYALIEEGFSLAATKKSTNKGLTWSNTGNMAPDIGSQAWYDLTLEVDPNNADIVYAGGIRLSRSVDGGNNWTRVSRYPSHPDYHKVVFRGNSSSEAIILTDGGVEYSSNFSSAQPSYSRIHKNYVTSQFYACAIHPDAGEDYYLGGMQDNGTDKLIGPGLVNSTHASGGDGIFCFIDKLDPRYQISSHIGNNYYLLAPGQTFFQKLPNNGGGMFVNPADYDYNQKILYSTLNNNSIHRIMDITGTPYASELSASLGNSFLERGSAYKVSPFTTNSTSLFVGTTVGKLYKILNANTNSPTQIDITGSAFPAGNISCIELGSNENEIIVIFSNYGVNSVWYTNNGGSTWNQKDGNLPDMPIWWAAFNPLDHNELLLATEVGLWFTDSFNSTSPNYSPYNNDLAHVRATMIRVRESDNKFVVSTYGRGLFTGTFSSNTTPPSTTTVTLTLNLDFYPTETSWELKNTSGQVIESGSGYTNSQRNTTITRNFDLSEGCYDFVVSDSYGDGGGAYTITSNGNTLVNSNGQYGNGETKNFCTNSSLSSIPQQIVNIEPLSEQIKIYPNPVSDLMTIKNKQPIHRVIIYNNLGRVINVIESPQNQKSLTIPMSNYAPRCIYTQYRD